MKLFVYEHITSGALINEPLPASLAHEGREMLKALVNDLSQLANLELIVLQDARIDPLDDLSSPHQCYTIHKQTDFGRYYQIALNDADAVLPIAPETDNALSLIQQSVINSGKRLLASLPTTSELCSDKYRCYQHLSTHKLATPATCLAENWSAQLFCSNTGYIVKPLDGVGCVDTLFFADNRLLEIGLAKQVSARETMIVQPYIKGLNVSLNLLCSDDDCMILAINEQHIKNHHDQLIYCGSTVNGVSESQLSFATALKLAKHVHQAIAGLWGLIGIDLILTEDAILIVDINPRLTSSYIGLARSLKQNPAELLFSMIKHNKLPLLTALQREPVEVLL